jgi:DNA-binding response OmpR family regulator
MAACRAIRLAQGQQSGLPVVVIAVRQDSTFGEAAGVTDWLIKPFSESFIRTKVRAWCCELRVAGCALASPRTRSNG